MLKHFKLLTLRIVKGARVFSLVHNSNWRSQRLLILAYHGLSLDDEHEWSPGLYMKPDYFAARLRLLKTIGSNVLPLGEGLRRLYSGDLPGKSVVITFDDGAYDFYRLGYPLLQQYGFPATLYLTTFYSYYNRPVFDVMVSYLLWKGRVRSLDLGMLTSKDGMMNLSEAGARSMALRALLDFARERNLSAEEKDALLGVLAKELMLDYDEFVGKGILRILKPEEVEKLDPSLISVQLHTHRHRTPKDRQLFLREIEDNRTSILSMNHSRPTHFCYPSGVYDPAFCPWLGEAGIESATTCDIGLASPKSKPLFLPRLLDTSSISPIEFESWVTGVSAKMPQRPITSETGNSSRGLS